MEIWKDIEGYENLYQVSNLGRIRSCGRICKTKGNSTQEKKAKVLVQEITIHGYCRVRLYDNNGKSKHYATHRLVAAAFIDETDRTKQINHKNEIKTDNRVENLEYCTQKENCNYGTRNIRISKINSDNNIWAKAVIQKDKNGQIIKRYPSRLEASRVTGIDTGHIAKCCIGKRKSAGGYVWENT